MYRFEAKELEQALLTGLLKFSEGLFSPDELSRITDELCEVWYNYQCNRGTLQDVRGALIKWYEEQLKVLQGEVSAKSLIECQPQFEKDPKELPNPKNRELTRKQRLFIKYYVDCGVGAKSARLAGYSSRSAEAIAYENLRKPQIKRIIEEKLLERDLER